MLDPTGQPPGAVPPHVLSALRGETDTRDQLAACASSASPARARADLALARLDLKVAALAEARARHTDDTAEAAFLPKAAAIEVVQASLAAFSALNIRLGQG